MGGLWAKNCRHRTDQRPPITIWSFLTGSGSAGLCCKPGYRLSARPNGRPRLQPPRPALRRGRVLAGMGAVWRRNWGRGQVFCGGWVRPCRRWVFGDAVPTVSPRRRPGSIPRSTPLHSTPNHLRMDSGLRRNDTVQVMQLGPICKMKSADGGGAAGWGPEERRRGRERGAAWTARRNSSRRWMRRRLPWSPAAHERCRKNAGDSRGLPRPSATRARGLSQPISAALASTTPK